MYNVKAQQLYQSILDKTNLPKRDKLRLLRKINGEKNDEKTPCKTLVKYPKPKSQDETPKNDIGIKSFSGLRSKEMIKASGAYQREYYAPITNKKNSEEDKRKLQHFMTYGASEEKSPLFPRRTRVKINFHVLSEINERREFLEKIKESERYREYEAKINSEISQRIVELENIDKNRKEEIEKIKNELKHNQTRKLIKPPIDY